MLYYDIFCMFLYYNDLLYIHIYIFRDILYHMFVYIYMIDLNVSFEYISKQLIGS